MRKQGFAAMLLLALALVAVCYGCGKTPIEPECVMVVTDTLFVEPGHKIGAYILTPICTDPTKDYRLHTRGK